MFTFRLLNLVGEEVELAQFTMTLDGLLECLKVLSVEVAAVESERLQLFLVRQRVDEGEASFTCLLHVVVREEQISKACVCLQTSGKHLHGFLAHLVVTHEYLLDSKVRRQGLRDGRYLLVCEHILHQVEVAQRQDVEQVSEHGTRDLVVINVNLRQLVLALKHLDEMLSANVVDVVVCHLELLERVAVNDKVAQRLATSRGDLVAGHAESLQTLLLLVSESFQHNFETFVANVVTSEVQLLDGLREGQAVFQRLDTLQADLVLLQVEYFEVFLVLKALTKSHGALSKDTIAIKSQFSDILLVGEYLANGSGAARSNIVLRQEKLTKRRLCLDRFANGNTSIRHDLIVV